MHDQALANLCLTHLLLRLRPLNRALQRAVLLRESQTKALAERGAVAEKITFGHAAALLENVDDLIQHRGICAGPAPFTGDEEELEEQLRAKAESLGFTLPLDRLEERLGLDEFELEAVALSIAPELETDYRRLFAFIDDGRVEPSPSVGLLCALTASSFAERAQRLEALGPHGALCRLGLLATAEGHGLLQQRRPTPAALDVMLRGASEGALLDPHEVILPEAPLPPPSLDLVKLERAVSAVRGGALRAVGIFGPSRSGIQDAVHAFALGLEQPLRSFDARDVVSALAAVERAQALGAVLWLDAEVFAEQSAASLEPVLRVLARAGAQVVVSGQSPWRPAALLEAGYLELELTELDHAQQSAQWASTPLALPLELCTDLSTRFRFGPEEIRLAAETAAHRHQALDEPIDRALEQACATVARKGSLRHAQLIVANREASELVLPPELHARVLDISDFYRHLPRVSEQWGFARRRTDRGGVKALFTGDSGTGKTLAAEIVATRLGLPLLKVDLARVVSKWVGETEKNLDLVFREAEQSQAVLFFDEAEALFGTRAEVKHGSDRYANLEVSFLLQRLDAFAGVAILASNLKEKIDAAFTRRFQVVIGFPRPQEPERRRLWSQAFPAQAPVRADVDFQLLARLDLTGAGIVGAAQTAALLAARSAAPEIEMRHVVWGVARQFQREARVLSPHDLGPHARLLQEAA